MKKITTILLALLMVLVTSFASAQTFTVGIEQFAEHASLDNCKIGFIEGLKQEGFVEGENLEILFQNAQANTGDGAQIAQSFVANDVSLICAIATPSAQACYNAVLTSGKQIPVIYTAVSAPIEAGLAMEDNMPVDEVTGTSDLLPVQKQLEMIRTILPDAKKVGILYTSSETNSEVQVQLYEQYKEQFGFEIVTSTVTTGGEVAQAIEMLLPEVDCVTMVLDNTVVSYLPTILNAAEKANKPVFGSEIEQVKLGCLAAEGLDYVALGIQTGKMAARVLKGEKASDMPFELLQESALYFNSYVAENLNITLPQALVARGTDMAE